MPELAPRLRVLESITEVSAAAWDALALPTGSPFLRHAWIAALEESGSATAETGWEPHHVTLWRGARLAAAAPAYRKHHSMGEYIYDFGWAHAAAQLGVPYYPKLLVGVPLSPATAPRLLVHPGEDASALRPVLIASLVESAREGCSSLHVLFPPEEEVRLLVDAGLAPRLSLQYHWVNPGYRSYDEYLQRFDAKRRAQLKRERSAAAEQGISLRTVRAPELGPEHAARAYGFYASTCEKKPWGQAQLSAGFFARAVAGMGAAVEMVEAVRGGRVIAGAFNVCTADRLYGRYWGAAEDHPFLHFNVCLYHSVDECIRLERRCFEPGAGGEHKIPRGFVPTGVHSAHLLFHPRLDRAVRAFLSQEEAEHRSEIARGEALAGLKPWHR